MAFHRLGIPAAFGACLALLVPPAGASDYCASQHEVAVADTVYVVVDYVLTEKGLFSVWVYVESNGEPGLQRGGTCPWLGDCDACQESANPDTGIF